ncbi:MAG: zf-TFIIB domain-containing protein [Clostridia bacterium]|nr:zf-TFIIB domain-containing protein [Clostridia bacterium]MDH7572899.1 zf-TFIIB domain-containing protein [Clostridia bacterium]
MKCPLCEVTMKEVERRGVLIDVCPECRGVWLDRGELEKLLSVSQHERDEEARYEESHPKGRRHEDHEPYPPYKKKHKRRSFLEDLFDFD